MQSRFSGTIAKWLGLQAVANLQPGEDVCLCSFRFNPPNAFPEIFRVPYTVIKPDNKGFEIHIPAFRPVQYIKGPNDTIAVNCVFTGAGCTLSSGAAAGSSTVALTLPYNDTEIPAQVITLPLLQSPGSLIVIAAALTFIIVKNGQEEKCSKPSCMPCSVIKSYYL